MIAYIFMTAAFAVLYVYTFATGSQYIFLQYLTADYVVLYVVSDFNHYSSFIFYVSIVPIL